MRLGKVYYSEDIILVEKQDFIDYIKIGSHTEIVDDGMPTLIIGWNLIKPKGNLDIQKKKIKNNIHWTFSFSERKSDYVRDLSEFPEKIFDYHIKKFNKKLITYPEVLDVINSESEVYINSNKVMYINSENITYITDIKEIVYFNEFSIKDFMLKISTIPKKFFYDKNDTVINRYYQLYDNITTESVKYLCAFLFFNNY